MEIMNTLQYLFVAVVVLNVLDILTTLHGLSIGKREINPVMSRLMLQFGAAPALIVSKAVFLGLIYWLMADIQIIGMSIICAMFVGLLINNFRELGKK